MAKSPKPVDRSSARARKIALFMAGVGVFWILAFQVGEQYDLSQRMRGLLDLIALAGFTFGLWLAIKLWRDRRTDKD